MIAYVVYSESGSYSDYTKNNICICMTEATAKTVITGLELIEDFCKQTAATIREEMETWDKLNPNPFRPRRTDQKEIDYERDRKEYAAWSATRAQKLADVVKSVEIPDEFRDSVYKDYLSIGAYYPGFSANSYSYEELEIR